MNLYMSFTKQNSLIPMSKMLVKLKMMTMKMMIMQMIKMMTTKMMMQVMRISLVKGRKEGIRKMKEWTHRLHEGAYGWGHAVPA